MPFEASGSQKGTNPSTNAAAPWPASASECPSPWKMLCSTLAVSSSPSGSIPVTGLFPTYAYQLAPSPIGSCWRKRPSSGPWQRAELQQATAGGVGEVAPGGAEAVGVRGGRRLAPTPAVTLAHGQP